MTGTSLIYKEIKNMVQLLLSKTLEGLKSGFYSPEVAKVDIRMSIKKIIVAALVLSAANYASAATQTWDFVNGSGSGIENDNAHGLGTGSYIDMTVGGVEVVISAWSSTEAVNCNVSDCSYDSDPGISRAELKKYSGGLGAINNDEVNDSPNHAFDSRISYNPSNPDEQYIDFDMMLLEFDTEVELTEIDIDWYGGDSDMIVLNYAGSGNGGIPFGATDTWSGLLNEGWNFVGENMDVSTTNNAIVANSFESKYWLVGVYNPAIGNYGTNYGGNDAVKIAGVVTKTTDPSTQVPEPATYALVLMGLIAAFRRKS